MPNVVRFTLPAARNLNVLGAGQFVAGVLDVDANNLSLVSRTRYLVRPYGAIEVGIVPEGTAAPSLPAVPAAPAPDPYPQYVTDADLGNPSSSATAAVRAAIGSVRAGHRLVGLGDSITAADAYLRYLTVLSGGRIRFVHNAGVGGNEITQMLARFDTDVTPYAPTMVSLLGGTNDFTFGTTDTQFRDRVKSFVTKVRAIGAIPLLFTSPPCEPLADSDRAKIVRNNVWMAAYAARQGIPLVDAYAVLADPTGYGNYITAYDSGDGIHPSEAGHFAVAQAAAAILNPLLAPLPTVAVTSADPTNLAANGFLKDVNADTWPDSWSQNWGVDAGTAAFSIVSDTAVPGGTMHRTTLTGVTGKNQFTHAVTTGFSAGDVMRLTALVTNTANTTARVHATSSGAGGFIADVAQAVARPVTRGLIDLSFAVPAGTTSIALTLVAEAQGAGVTGTVDFGAATLRNETVLGLLSP